MIISPTDHYSHYWVFHIWTSAMLAPCGVGLVDVSLMRLNSHFWENTITKYYAYVITSCSKKDCFITAHDMKKKQTFNDFDVDGHGYHEIRIRMFKLY